MPEKSHGQRSLAGYRPWGCKRVRCNCVTKHTGVTAGFPGGARVKKPPAHAGDVGPTCGLGRSPGEGDDNILQFVVVVVLMF